MIRASLAFVLICLTVWLSGTGIVEGFVFLGPRWESPTTTFFVDIPGAGGLWNGAFEDAMSYWNDATEFNLVIDRSLEPPCDAPDGQNGVAFADSVCGDAFGQNTLAVTIAYSVGDFFTDTDIIFNDARSWNVYDGPYASGPWQNIDDFRRVAVHELGHSLGLGHEDSATSIMSTSVAVGDTITRPQSDDISGVIELYGFSGATSDGPPDIPGGLFPNNGAKGVSLTPTLSWRAVGGATSYDVHLGTSSDPPFVQNVTESLYIPGALTPSQTYRWKIISKNSFGSGSTGVASFTTTGIPPSSPTGLRPEDGEPNVSLTPLLQWNPSDRAASYKVYLGITTDLPLSGLAFENSFTPAALEENQSYFWRVVAANNFGLVSSPTQQFTTVGPPAIASMSVQVGKPGTTVQSRLNGAKIGSATEISIEGEGVTVTIAPVGANEDSRPILISIAPEAEGGRRKGHRLQ